MHLRFELSERTFDPGQLAEGLRDVECGALATFEGWVRRHNDGQTVQALEYEAYAELAEAEGQRILAEAGERFGIQAACCVHRVGRLELGDAAVWVGVSAVHRGPALQACSYIIEALKQRVPIWKKEHYETGDTGWVNCVEDGSSTRA